MVSHSLICVFANFFISRMEGNFCSKKTQQCLQYFRVKEMRVSLFLLFSFVLFLYIVSLCVPGLRRIYSVDESDLE